jgi:hypothetical protein
MIQSYWQTFGPIPFPESNWPNSFLHGIASANKATVSFQEGFLNSRPIENLSSKSRPSASNNWLRGTLFRTQGPVRPTASTGFMERAMGIEPTSEAWEVFLERTGFTPLIVPGTLVRKRDSESTAVSGSDLELIASIPQLTTGPHAPNTPPRSEAFSAGPSSGQSMLSSSGLRMCAFGLATEVDGRFRQCARLSHGDEHSRRF